MGFRKIAADKIFDGYKFLSKQVLITTPDGIIQEIIAEEDAGPDIEKWQGIISPGFINCHCHLELSHMKGLIPENTGLVNFVYKVVTVRHQPDAEILSAIEKAEDAMVNSGIVAVGDICNNTSTILQKEKKRIQYHNFIEASGWLPEIANARFERAKLLQEQFSLLPYPFSIVPHAPYSVSENLWQQIKPYFEKKVASIHNQETVFEDEFFISGTGDFVRMYEQMKIKNDHHVPTNKSSIQSYLHHLTNASSTILVHNTYIKQQDIDFVGCQLPTTRDQLSTITHRPSTFFCLCVNANLYIENTLPPIESFRKNNCRLVLGTDSLASNWSLNILDEIKTIHKNFSKIPLEEILKWATSNGAQAMEMDKILGSFEKGKKPGVINFKEDLNQIIRIV